MSKASASGAARVPAPRRTRIASYLITEYLERIGVDVIFGLCGHTIIGLLDAIGKSRIRYVSTRHEQIAAHAADGYARASGKVGVVLTHTSPDGDEGYPGTLHAKVTYTLTDRDELAIDYEATTDKATPVNLTNHTYWNLAGDGSRDILGHVLTLESSAIVPVDSTLIPTGKLLPVAGTPFDFRTPTAIGARIEAPHEQIRYGKGYDHTWVLDGARQNGLAHAAHVTEPTTGRSLDIYTTEPGVQFYSGNFLDGTAVGKQGHVYKFRYGLALETHHYPDSPNQPSFPSTILRPGQTYRTRTVYRFGTQ